MFCETGNHDYSVLNEPKIVSAFTFIMLLIKKVILVKGIFKERKYNFECISAIWHGIHDGIKGELGKNEKFLPGLKL